MLRRRFGSISFYRSGRFRAAFRSNLLFEIAQGAAQMGFGCAKQLLRRICRMPASTFKRIFSSPYNHLSPARIVLLYSFIAIIWILLSDTATALLVKDSYQFKKFVIFKEILFIIATSGLMYKLISYYAHQLRSSEETFHLAEQKIKKLAFYDLETGLPNHELLLDRLNQLIAFNSRKKKNSAVIYISLTGFKAVVDARGHAGGFEAVRGVAERLVSTLRHYDTVARIHRDEFVLVLGGACWRRILPRF